MSASLFLRRTLPQILIVFGTFWMVVEYFITPKWWTDVGTIIRNFAILISAFALGLGAIQAFAYHGTLIRKRTPGRWFYSLVLIGSMFVMLITGLIGWLDQPIFAFLWNNVTVPCQQTVYSLLMFYVAIAAYKAMRASSIESTLFMGCAVIIMWSNAPMLEALIPSITPMAQWILNVPNVGGARGYAIAATVGSIALYVRVLLGRELGMIGATREE